MRAHEDDRRIGYSIPFNKPLVLGREQEYVAEAIRTRQIAADGPFTRRCAQLMEVLFGIPKVLMTPSCTAALELAAMLCEVGPDDEVIMPSYTFVSTANAVTRLGARPVFVEIRPDTLNIDEAKIEEAITPRTKAIFPVHYAGVSCEMDHILRTARHHGLRVVEDAAQGVNSSYKGRALGSIGHFVTGQLLRVDRHTATATIVNAGHPFPLRLRDGRVEEVELEIDLPFGVESGHTYRVQTIPLRPGDRILLVTDGMYENAEDEMDVPDMLLRTAHLPARAVVHVLGDEVADLERKRGTKAAKKERQSKNKKTR